MFLILKIPNIEYCREIGTDLFSRAATTVLLASHTEAQLDLIDESDIAGELIAGNTQMNKCRLPGDRPLADKLPITLSVFGGLCA